MSIGSVGPTWRLARPRSTTVGHWKHQTLVLLSAPPRLGARIATARSMPAAWPFQRREASLGIEQADPLHWRTRRDQGDLRFDPGSVMRVRVTKALPSGNDRRRASATSLATSALLASPSTTSVSAKGAVMRMPGGPWTITSTTHSSPLFKSAERRRELKVAILAAHRCRHDSGMRCPVWSADQAVHGAAQVYANSTPAVEVGC